MKSLDQIFSLLSVQFQIILLHMCASDHARSDRKLALMRANSLVGILFFIGGGSGDLGGHQAPTFFFFFFLWGGVQPPHLITFFYFTTVNSSGLKNAIFIFLYKTLIDWISNELVGFPAFNFVRSPITGNGILILCYA